MGFPIFFVLGVALVTITTVGGNVPSSLYNCIDWECEEWISQGKTMLRYMGKTDKHLSFQKNQDIQIISKPVDKNLPDWVGKVGNKVGLVPRDMVQELKMNKNPTKFKLDLQEILELTSLDNSDGQEEEDDETEEEEDGDEQSSNEVDGIEIEDVDGEQDDGDVESKNEINVDGVPKTEEDPTKGSDITTEPTPSLSTAEVPITSIIDEPQKTIISAPTDENKISDKKEAEQETEIDPSLATTMNTFLEDISHQQQSADTTFQEDIAKVVVTDTTPVVEDFSSDSVPSAADEAVNQSYYGGDEIQDQRAFLSSAVTDPDVSSVNLQPSTDTVLQGSATIIDEYLTKTPKTMAVEQNQPPLSLSVEEQVTPRIPETVLLDTMASIIQNHTPSISSISFSAEQEQQIRATKVEKAESLVSKTFTEEEETMFALPPVEEKTRDPQQTESMISTPENKVGNVENEGVDYGKHSEEISNNEEILSPGKVETLQPHKLTGNDEEKETPPTDTRGSKFNSPPREKEAIEPPLATPELENKVQEETLSSPESVQDETLSPPESVQGETLSPPLTVQDIVINTESPSLERVDDQKEDSTQQEKVVPEEIIDLADKVDHQRDDVDNEAAEKSDSQSLESTPPASDSANVNLDEAILRKPAEAGLEPASAPEISEDQQQQPDQKEKDQEIEVDAAVLSDSEEAALTAPSSSSEQDGPLENDSNTSPNSPSPLGIIQDENITQSHHHEDVIASSEEPETILVPENTVVAAPPDESNETEPQQQPETDDASLSDSIPPPALVSEDDDQVPPIVESIKSSIPEEADKVPDEQSISEDISSLLPVNTTEIPPETLNAQNAAEDSSEATNVTPPSSPIISPFESKQQDDQGTTVPQSVSTDDEAVTDTSTEAPTQKVPAEAVVEIDEQQQPQQQQEPHSNEGTADHDHGHHHHHNPRHHHHHHHKRFTKDFLNDSSSTSSIILVIKHLSSTLLSFLPEPLQDTILDVDDALVFTGIIALTLVSICVPYFFIEGYMSVRPLKKKVVELNKSLWKVSAAYETQQEEFEIFKRKAIAHDEFRKRAEQSENDVVILKTLEQKHREQIQSLRVQLKSQMKEAKDIRALIEKTLQDKKVVEQESNKYKQTADKTAEALAKAKEELTNFQTHAKSTALQLGMSSKSAGVLTTKITLLEQETENLKSQLVGESEKRKAQGEEMNQMSQSKIGLERELADMKKICLQYEETVDGLNNEICKLDSELTTIKETLGEDSPLLELAEIQAKADFCEKEASSLRTRLEGVCADNENLRGKLQETETALEDTRNERDSLSKRLEVLEQYFKQREEELLKTIETQQQKEMVRDKGKDELIALIEERDETITQLNGTLDGLKEELVEVNGKHRNEIRSLEAKGHENWLSLCQAERKAQDARKDAELLRQRLTAMVKENARREAEEDDDDDGSDGLSMMFPSVIPHELVPPPILDDDLDEPAPPPSYFGLGEFVPPPPLSDDENDDDEHNVDQRRRPPPLGGTRLSPSFSDMSDDDVDNNNILSPIVRRRRDEECTDGSSGSGSSSPPLRSGGWINLAQQHRGGGTGIRGLPSSSSRTTTDPIQPGANL